MQEVGRDGGDDTQTHLSRSLTTHLGNGLVDVLIGTQRLTRLLQHHLTHSSGDDRLLRAVEQHHTKLLLEGLNLHRKRWLCHEAVLRSNRETTTIGYRQEVLKLNNSHSLYKSILFTYDKVIKKIYIRKEL